jgi:PKD repeat protein
MRARRRFLMSSRFLRIFFLATILILIVSIGSWAKPVSPDDAQKVAKNWIDYVVKNDGSWGEYKSAEAVKIEPFFVEGGLVGFVIDVAPLGFVLVPADDELPPIKAYSTDSVFIQDSEGFADWVGQDLKEITNMLRTESVKKVVFMPINAKLWGWLRENNFLESVPAVSTLPPPILTTTNWDQMDPYNRFCPEWPQDSGSKTPVGCVATASAQVMRYWSWPPQGTGSHSYTSQTHRFQLSADFNHAYNWDNMPDSLSFATSPQKDEVARLGSDLGIAFDMDYDPDGSGAYTTDAVSVLTQYFYYSSEIKFDGYTGDETSWFTLFKTEVDAGRPSLMSIRGPDGGHAVVCDGYRTDQGNMLHLNFGWGGWASTYYAPNNVKSSSFDLSWIDTQEIVRSIMPNEPQAPGALTSASPMGGKAPVTVSFAGQGKKGVGPYTYHWDFGDAATGNGQSPTHIYLQAGAYTVTLTVTDSISQTASDSHLVINVSSTTGLSVSAQSTSATTGKVPLTVDFSAVAQGGTPSYSYIWNFGDGGANEPTANTTISHTYTTSGNYTAVLTVKDAGGAQATATGIAITAQPAAPVPSITSCLKMASPFRLKLTGTNFISASKIKIDGVAVPSVLFKNSGKLIAGSGTALKDMCPKGQPVKVTVENEEGNVSNEYSYTR